MDNEEKQIVFLELYEESRESLVRYAKSIARNYQDAMDLVQETTLKAYDGFEMLNNRQAFKSYLFSIAARTHKRQRWRSRLFFNFSSYEKEFISFEEMSDNSANTDINYDILALREALEKLPAEQKEAVVLFEISGLSLEEIKEIQGISLPGVKSRLQRGRRTLTKLLGADMSPEQEAMQIENIESFLESENKSLKRNSFLNEIMINQVRINEAQ